jgi:hypothetical protein
MQVSKVDLQQDEIAAAQSLEELLDQISEYLPVCIRKGRRRVSELKCKQIVEEKDAGGASRKGVCVCVCVCVCARLSDVSPP